ncbi:MAE_28990/MAE_18760 family HEPN-like nuclease [Actinobacillus genomosp. 1]|uniref:MAE_28990/MAE_18760 family HEPN-like nuclease n=1 Tax=Actinobacillus genomosp. 1 TaxID=254839 RepID=UPI0024428C6C|nr:MAE_28990/MAE_18760 family HEPN-like nuclease [Actinobacillus genomosp. 1]WGE33632.1 MAE_28990/MAE_18760 family HEPN-like nuclease [Actinobacillus genomosp. 1]
MNLLEQEFYDKLEAANLFFDEIIINHKKVIHCTILKSSMVLMLYNISESTIRKILEYIHDDLSSFKMQELSEKLNSNFLKYNNESYFPTFKFFVKNKKGSLFSGNVDSRRICQELKKYGINITLPEGKEYLLKIKTLRNNLAHGNLSFKDATRNTTNNELLSWMKAIQAVFEQVIFEVKNFIKNKMYLDKSLP